MPEESSAAREVDTLASAVAHRFFASASRGSRTAQVQPIANPSLVDRLASAVGQRLAARTGTDIDRLASAVAHRLAASERATPLVASAASHFGGPGFAPAEVAAAASRAVKSFRAEPE